MTIRMNGRRGFALAVVAGVWVIFFYLQLFTNPLDDRTGSVLLALGICTLVLLVGVVALFRAYNDGFAIGLLVIMALASALTLSLFRGGF